MNRDKEMNQDTQMERWEDVEVQALEERKREREI